MSHDWILESHVILLIFYDHGCLFQINIAPNFMWSFSDKKSMLDRKDQSYDIWTIFKFPFGSFLLIGVRKTRK